MLISSLSVTNLFFIITDAYHKELTYVEYRAVSGVFQNDDPHPLLHPSSLSSPAPNAGGAGRWGGWGVNILEDARHSIGLYTIISLRCPPIKPVFLVRR